MTILAGALDGYAGFEDFAYHAYRQPDIMELQKSQLARAIRRLRDQGLIEEVKIKNDIFFKLTSSGEDLTLSEPKVWDGKWRIVIFDIPEQKRLVRDLFRRNLKKWGFKYLQKSVWISKRDVFEKLSIYVKDLGIERWVTVIEADKLSQEPILSNM